MINQYNVVVGTKTTKYIKVSCKEKNCFPTPKVICIFTQLGVILNFELESFRLQPERAQMRSRIGNFKNIKICHDGCVPLSHVDSNLFSTYNWCSDC